MVQPVLFQYDSHSKFLSDYIEFKRANSSKFSLGPWARKLGVGSGTLFNIAQGKRQPSVFLAGKISNLLGFQEYEHEFWMNLIQLNQKNQTHETVSLIRKRLRELKPQKNYRLIDLDLFKKISDPMTYAIREMVNLRGFQENAMWIKQRLRKANKLSIDEIQDRLQALKTVGLLTRNQNDQLVVAEAVYKTPAEMKDESTKQFYESAVKIALQSVRGIDPDHRHLSATTFCFNKKDIPQIKDAIEEFQRQLLNQFDTKGGEEVGQVTIQFAPLTNELANGAEQE